jgi:hypothetical protein
MKSFIAVCVLLCASTVFAQGFQTKPMNGPSCLGGVCPVPQDFGGWQPARIDNVDQTAGADAAKQYFIPFRNEMVKQQAETKAEIGSLQGQMDQIINSLNSMKNQQVQVPPVPEAPKEDEASKMKTMLGRLTDKEASWLAEHGGPISGRIAANAEENMDSDSAAVRFKGFTQAKVALLIFCATIIIILALVVRVGHKLVDKFNLLEKAKEAAAKTSTTADDKAVELWEKLHNRIDGVEQKIADQLPNLAALKAKADAAINIGTAAALAAPAGSAASAAAATVAAAAAKTAATQ